MAKIDPTKLKPIQFNKRKVRDPARYPSIIIPIENKMKVLFEVDQKVMIADLTKEMVKIKKEK